MKCIYLLLLVASIISCTYETTLSQITGYFIVSDTAKSTETFLFFETAMNNQSLKYDMGADVPINAPFHKLSKRFYKNDSNDLTVIFGNTKGLRCFSLSINSKKGKKYAVEMFNLIKADVLKSSSNIEYSQETCVNIENNPNIFNTKISASEHLGSAF